MIGLIDLHDQGLVAAALAGTQPLLLRLDQPSDALRELDAGRIRALVCETTRPDRELATLLASAAAAGVPALVVSREREIAAAVARLGEGATDVLVAPFEYESLARAIDRLCAASTSPGWQIPFVTGDPETIQTLALVRNVAASDATVLVEGESGTGKELLARLVHGASPRAGRTLVTVNCAALPAGLLESELFGYERGAFTGAVARNLGKFELAHGGTIMLDEIGELELGLQAKLLRVIQEKEVQRIGARRPTAVDFRLVATTNRNLSDEVCAGRFREDLFYRLNVLPVRLKPLRERPGDVSLLVDHLLEIHAQSGRALPLLSSEARRALEAHPWPGNVRELENVIERIVLTCPGQNVTPETLALTATSRHGPSPVKPPFRTIREMERWLIVETLARLDGNRTHTARELDISLRTLRNKIREYGVDEPETLPRSGTARAARGGRLLPGEA